MRGWRRLAGVIGLLMGLACTPTGGSPAAPAAPPAAKPAASAAPPAPGGAPTAAAKPAPVTIAYAYPVISSQFWQLFIGKEKGLYADEGVNLEPTVVAAGNPAITQGVVSGAYQVGSISADVLVNAVEQGAALTFVAGEVSKPVFGIVVQPDIMAWGDFRGKGWSIGTASVRGGTATLMRWIAGQQGLREGPDYTIVPAGSTAERSTALRAKTIAASPLGQPQDFQMQDEGLRTLGTTADYIPHFALSYMIVRRDWASGHEDELTRVLRAHIRSIRWLYDPANKAQAIALLAEATKTEPRYAERTYELQVERIQMWPRDGALDIPAIEDALKIMADEGELNPPIPPASKYYDARYWEQARATVDRR